MANTKAKPRRRRIVIRVVVFLVLGAIVNVGAAWASALSGYDALYIDPDFPTESIRVPTGIPTRWHAQPRIHAIAYRLCTVTVFRWNRDLSEGDEFNQNLPEGDHPWTSEQLFVARFDFGWPSRSLRVERWLKCFNFVGTMFTSNLDAKPQRGVWTEAVAITRGSCPPLHPLWPGFAMNTIFYAAILWLLWATPFAIRRRCRIKHGRCGPCGYDLTGAAHDKCPECGRPVAGQ